MKDTSTLSSSYYNGNPSGNSGIFPKIYTLKYYVVAARSHVVTTLFNNNNRTILGKKLQIR